MVQTKYSFRKGVQYWEENFLNFFGLCFIRFVFASPLAISNKMPWSIQSSKQWKFIVLINIFSRSHVSYFPVVCMWHGKILHNRKFRLHLQEEAFIISMFPRWKQICFYLQWQFGDSSYWIMWGLLRHHRKNIC